MTAWQAGGYAPMDGTPILVLEADGSGATTVSYRTIGEITGWFSVDEKLFSDGSADDVSIFGAGWILLPPMQEIYAREQIEAPNG